jgi:hypothetical protein
MTVGLDYTISGGDDIYNGIWIDYDYDWITFVDTVEVTPTGVSGDFHYDLNIPSVSPGYEYFIAIRVYDDDAPNLYDTYVWMTPFTGGAPIVVVNDGGTSNANAIKSDLNALNAGYSELNSSQVSSVSDLTSYKLVIWCCGTGTYQLSSTERGILYSYVMSNGGNLFVPYNRLYYTSLTSAQRQMFGYSSLYSWYISSYIDVYSGNSYGPNGGNPYVARTGVGGGTISRINCSYLSPVTDVYYYYRQPNTLDIVGERGYSPYYNDGAMRDNGTAGDNQGWAAWMPTWNYLTSTYPDSSVGRKGVLWRIIEKMDPSLI